MRIVSNITVVNHIIIDIIYNDILYQRKYDMNINNVQWGIIGYKSKLVNETIQHGNKSFDKHSNYLKDKNFKWHTFIETNDEEAKKLERLYKITLREYKLIRLDEKDEY